jgi:hypothetical protein
MRIPIFWRLVLSHLGILSLSGAACLYSITQLGSVSGSARTALVTSQQMTAYKEALIDTFLSQVRYGGKYLITHTEGRRDQLLQFKKDFVDYLDRLKRLEQSESIGASLSHIERLHEQYHELFDREAAYIRANQNYAQTRYQQERDKTVENTLEEFDVLKAQLRASQQERLASIERGARTARRIAIITTLVVLIFGALFSLKVSRSLDASLSETFVAKPLANVSWIQNLHLLEAKLLESLRDVSKLQIKRFNAFALYVIGAWNRRCARPKSAPRGKVTDL